MANFKTYSEKLKDPRWQKKRLEILNRDKFKCKKCGDTKTTLCIHHLKYVSVEPWGINNKYLVTLCEDCHDIIEANKDTSYIDFIIHKTKCWVNGSYICFVKIKYNIFLIVFDRVTNSKVIFSIDNNVISDFKKGLNKIKL